MGRGLIKIHLSRPLGDDARFLFYVIFFSFLFSLLVPLFRYSRCSSFSPSFPLLLLPCDRLISLCPFYCKPARCSSSSNFSRKNRDCHDIFFRYYFDRSEKENRKRRIYIFLSCTEDRNIIIERKEIDILILDSIARVFC